VTSCIHNILSGQRWIEHYGEIVIKNLSDDSCHCKVNFIKVTDAGRAEADPVLKTQAILKDFSLVLLPGNGSWLSAEAPNIQR
jgi:hypothetical protein